MFIKRFFSFIMLCLFLSSCSFGLKKTIGKNNTDTNTSAYSYSNMKSDSLCDAKITGVSSEDQKNVKMNRLCNLLNNKYQKKLASDKKSEKFHISFQHQPVDISDFFEYYDYRKLNKKFFISKLYGKNLKCIAFNKSAEEKIPFKHFRCFDTEDIKQQGDRLVDQCYFQGIKTNAGYMPESLVCNNIESFYRFGQRIYFSHSENNIMDDSITLGFNENSL